MANLICLEDIMNYEQMHNNKVYIAGEIITTPTFSHEVLGEGFYEFDLKVKRLSGFYDTIPVTISERLINENELKLHSVIAGNGQFRSYNKLEGKKSRLLLTVFLREVLPYDEKQNPNVIEINGYVCKEPIYRTTPFKREICDVLIAVNRSYNKSDYLPCIAWGRNAKYVKEFSVGDNIKIVGRIQSRVYQKKLSETEVVQKTAFEISLNKISKCESIREFSAANDMHEVNYNYYAN